MSKTSVLLAVAAALAVVAPVEAREGFGFTKKAVSMTRKKPPALSVGARRVKVAVSAGRSEDKDDASTLARYTEDLILAGAGSLAPEKDRGEMTIKLTVDRLESHESRQSKTETKYEKIGEKQVYNDSKKKYETKDVYGNVYVQVEVTTVTGDLSGSYDITDRAGKVIDSGNLSQQYEERFEDGKQAPTPSRVEDDLLNRAAVAVASRIVPTTDTIQVLVPKGSFESLIPLAETNVWDRYRAGVEAVPQNRDARAEAYRQYALGVAKEGQAYASDRRAETIALLQEAVKHYETAMTSNPGEKLFREAYSSLFSRGTAAPLVRASASLTSFEAWATNGSIAMAAKKSAGFSAAKMASASGSSSSSSMTNETLIEMSKAGLTEENLILAIDEARDAEFDTTPTALIALSKAGVSKNVIAHMQKKKKGTR